jgi:hypothetical protein
VDAFDRYVYRALAGAVVVLLGGGTILFHFIEKWSWINAWYFCVVTLATVGYGDLVPKTDVGKLVTTFYIIIGVGIITTFFTATARRRGAIMRQKQERKNGNP